MSDSQAAEVTTLRGEVLRITTGSRLHFGLLNTVAPFGGVGVMIDHPQTEIVIRPAESFQCTGEGSDRIVGIAQRISLAQQRGLPSCAIEVSKRSQPHSGLGSGTQLAMAVAEGLARFAGLTFTPEVLARRLAERGQRSAVGVHGYLHGGLIYEEADDDPCQLNAIRQRVAIPQGWCVALFRPAGSAPQVSGAQEQNRFRQLGRTSQAKLRLLTAMINQQLLPAAKGCDFAAFADAVQCYNYESGLLFQDVQGGPYHGPAVSELVQALVSCGAVGVGQSSWGPTVFAWFEDADQAAAFEQTLPGTVNRLGTVRPLNRPRILRSDGGSAGQRNPC